MAAVGQFIAQAAVIPICIGGWALACPAASRQAVSARACIAAACAESAPADTQKKINMIRQIHLPSTPTIQEKKR